MRPVLCLLLAMSLSAQTPPPPAPPPPPPETKQFDFWLGEWEVTNPAGKIAGANRIEAMANGRGLLENWTGAGGYSGKSLNAWNAAKKRWQQFWVGSDGTVLELSGGLDAQGRMALADAANRITWTPNADGTVRQFWETTKDGGKTWTVAFDGLYRRKK
jgi:hypothetical protein